MFKGRGISIPEEIQSRGGAEMRSENEAYLTVYRFVRELARSQTVKSIHSLMVGTEMHVWVVLRNNSREARYSVYDAQLRADPEFLLTLHFTDTVDRIPADAERVDRVGV